MQTTSQMQAEFARLLDLPFLSSEEKEGLRSLNEELGRMNGTYYHQMSTRALRQRLNTLPQHCDDLRADIERELLVRARTKSTPVKNPKICLILDHGVSMGEFRRADPKAELIIWLAERSGLTVLEI